MAGQSMSGQQIYDNFANAVGPDGLAQAADCVTEIQGRYDDRATEIRAVRQAERIIPDPPLVSAELYVEQRDRNGRHRCQFPLRVYDTATGRWALQISKHYDEERWDLSAATTTRVADLLDGLHSRQDS